MILRVELFNLICGLAFAAEDGECDAEDVIVDVEHALGFCGVIVTPAIRAEIVRVIRMANVGEFIDELAPHQRGRVVRRCNA